MPYIIKPKIGYKKRMPYKKPATTRRTVAKKFARTKPSRYIASKKQYMSTRTMTQKLSQVAETFYNPLATIQDTVINGSTNSSQVKFKGYTIGQTVPSHLAGYEALNGVDFSTAQGKYVYMKKAQALITIEMDSSAAADSLTYVRILLYKNKKSVSPAGSIANPNTQLFLNNDGTHVGQSSTAFNGKMAMLAKTNSQNFIVYRDHRMTLSNPYITPTGDRAYSGKYPVKKMFRFNMPYFKKVMLGADNTPTDIDYHYNILVLVTTQNSAGTPTDCTISLNNHLVTWTDM